MKQTRRARHGAAYTEAAMMLPVFMIIFAGMHLFHNGFTAKLQAMNQGRREAWRVVSDYEECGTMSLDDPRSELDLPPEVDSEVGGAGNVDIPPAGDGSADAENARAEGGNLIEKALGGLFGEAHHVEASVDYERPKFLSDEAGVASASYWVICNPEPKDFGTLLKDMFCSITTLC